MENQKYFKYRKTHTFYWHRRLWYVGPIAEILYHRGYHITGSDISESETVQKFALSNSGLSWDKS